MSKIDNFNGTITRQVVNSRKLNFGEKIRTLTISDLHGYIGDNKRTSRLAEAIKMEEPDVIFIAGDSYNGGKAWEGGEILEQFRRFVQNISEVAPVCVTWGNHDLRSLNPRSKEERLKNLRGLEDVRPGSVFPLYNEKVFVNGMEIVGYVPRFELMELEGYGEKSISNLIDGISKSKNNSLERLICALGIKNVGKRTSGKGKNQISRKK